MITIRIAKAGTASSPTASARFTGMRVSARNGAKKCAPIRMKNTIAVVFTVSSSAAKKRATVSRRVHSEWRKVSPAPTAAASVTVKTPA